MRSREEQTDQPWLVEGHQIGGMLMARYLGDELATIDDIAALLSTARSLAVRFHDPDMYRVADQIAQAIAELNLAREHKSKASDAGL